MTKLTDFSPTFPNGYFAGSRFLTHSLFWVGYYLLFSIIWMKPDIGYFASFFLEFILMPVRILAAYCMIYVLIPSYLVKRRYKAFFSYYALLIILAGALQTVFGYFFYEKLLLATQANSLFSLSGLIRNCILINTTVLLLGTAKVFQLYIQLQNDIETKPNGEINDYIEVKSDRAVHRLKTDSIAYVQGMGNYVTYYLIDGDKKLVYGSLKEAQKQLPAHFIRIHRSYIANRELIEAYSQEQVTISGLTVPRGASITDAELSLASTS